MSWLLEQIRGVVNSIISAAVETVIRPIYNSVLSVVPSVWQYLNWVWSTLGPAISGLQQTANSIYETVRMGLQVDWTQLWNTVSSAAAAGVAGLQATLAGVPKAIQDLQKAYLGFGSTLHDVVDPALAGTAQSFTRFGLDLHATLDPALAGIQQSTAALPGQMSTMLDGATRDITKGFSEAWTGFGGWMQTAGPGLVNTVIGGFWGAVAAASEAVGEGVKDAQKAVGGLFEDLSAGFMGQMQAAFKPGSPPKKLDESSRKMFEEMLRDLERTTKVEGKSVPPYEALMAAVVGTAGKFLAIKVLVEGLGAAADVAHPLRKANIWEIAAGATATLGIPNVIGPLIMAPVSWGLLKNWEYHWAARYTPIIPGSGDLITFVVREVITPEKFRELMPFHGYSAEVADWYWEAHWVLPPMERVFDGYVRGVITDSDVGKYLVFHDYKPTPRPGITKSDVDLMLATQYTLLGRITARWAWEWGLLSDEAHMRLWAERGVDPRYVKLAAEAERINILRAEVGRIRTRLVDDVGDGVISKTVMEEGFKELPYAERVKEWHRKEADVRLKGRRVRELRDAWQRAYRYLDISAEEYEKQLKELEVPEEEIKHILTRDRIWKFGKPTGPGVS